MNWGGGKKVKKLHPKCTKLATFAIFMLNFVKFGIILTPYLSLLEGEQENIFLGGVPPMHTVVPPLS